MASNLKKIDTGYVAPKKFRAVEKYRTKAIRNKVKSADKRVLFVFDHTFTQDIHNGYMLSDANGQRFFLLCELANTYYGSKYSEQDLDWMAVPFNHFKTYGKDNDDIRAEANTSFVDHIKEIIVDYKPDVVMTFGKTPFEYLCPQALQRTKGNFTNYLGTTVDTTVISGKKEHNCIIVPSISLNSLFSAKNPNNAYLSGYVARNMVTALDGGTMRYAIPKIHSVKKGKFVPKYKTHFVTKINDVKKLLDKMAKEKFVAVDTETENLYRIHNKIQTVQFCSDPTEAYVVPIYHEDSPFSGKELKKIIGWLRDYFEQKNKNKVQIYTNAKFDLNVMRTNFGIRYYKADVWDICAGEFAIDENMKLMHTVTGKGYYNLGNLAVQYGCFAFYDNPFGKENRAHIADNPLTEAVLQYCSLDVVVPWLIFKQQLRRAKDIKYTKYRKMVSKMVGDQIHSFSTLETTGALCDIDYLFYLKTLDSPVNKIIEEKEQKIINSKAVRKANELLSKSISAPTAGLFGKVTLNNFDLSKSEHKQILFFDVLKLKMLEEGKKVRPNGQKEGSIGKKFLEYHASNEIVASYQDLQKAYKIRNSYVNSFISMYADDVDFKRTKRLRPTYSYQDVVTGRTSASDPNLQQIPSRGALSKYIKRLLISSPGTMLIKVDYSAHEVRGWSIISGEQGIADVFDVGKKLRDRYKLVPDPWIKHRIDMEGDVHKINAAYFFGLPIEVVHANKDIRNAVKTVIFGLIYQQGDEGLAASTKRKVDEIVKIKKQFLDRFPVGLKWFDEIKGFAKKNYYVESPVGRRRTLWPLLFLDQINSNPKDKDNYILKGAVNKCLRQAVNSPVQGFGSDFMMIAIRLIERYKFEYYLKTGQYPLMNLNVSVHDSLTVEVGYEWFWLAIDFIERAMTTGAQEYIEETFDYKVLSTPEMDFDVGATERDVKGWDFSYNSMEDLIRAGLKTQVEELGHTINIDKVTKSIMQDQYHLMPDWMKKQLWANDIKIKNMGKSVLSKSERKQAESYISEFKANRKLLAKYEKGLEKKDAELRTKQKVAAKA